ncbi:MAG TPA: amino acid adenylation domain-containing protein, partial [Pyrinomonadaceae bacterium]|nr:amino acid adenylation domain-containing protein [Pyrinomonadaceae bacterium]
MHKSNFEPSTFVEALRLRAINQPDRLAYTFLLDGETEEVKLTYGELDRRARNIARLLQSSGEGGKRALLLYPPGFDYIAAFFGCLYAGVVAVPVYPPRLNQSLLRFQAIIEDAQATLALTTAPLLSRVKPIFDQTPELKNLRVLSTDMLPDNLGDDWQEPDVNNETLALLQYTSGSTSTPKGVVLTHRNLIHNSGLLSHAFEYTSESRGVSWLPMYHDMGLIGGILQPLYRGFPCVLMSPVSFLQRPFRWLDAISRYEATTSGGPNFAYDLCLHKITAQQRLGLDLTKWSVAFNGAEPIRRETLERFAEVFGACGFRKEAFFPCYGLAEATLIVAGGPKAGPPVVKAIQASLLENNLAVELLEETEGARLVVSSGPAMSGQKIVVVHPETLTECLPNEIGEVWVSGDSVAAGYWNNPAETAHTFHAYLKDTGEGPFLRTGDLGFFQGELFVTGRLKDLIIIRGLNHYPQDIELTVERSHASVRPNCTVAFSVYLGDEERLVVVLEVEQYQQTDFDDVIATVQQAVAENHELQAHAVVLLKRGRIPKTSSGKVQRQLCRAKFMANSLEVLAEWREGVVANIEVSNSAVTTQPKSMETVEARLTSLVAMQLGMGSSMIDVNKPITRYGLDSLGAIELIHRLEVDLNVVLPMESLLQGPSITQLAAEIRTRSMEPPFDSVPLIASVKEEVLEHSLSRGQQALWFLHQAAPESTAYSIASALRIRGHLDPHTMRRAFQVLVNRHASLRTTFAAALGTPHQLVQPQMEVSFAEEDASPWGDDSLNDHLIQETLSPFDLERGPLFRVKLFARSKSEHILLLVVHHIVADFWSLGVLMHELAQVYSAESAKSPSVLPPLLSEYTDYVRWQEKILVGPEGENLWNYWKEQLAGELPTLNLPVDHVRPSVQASRGKSYPFKLSAELTYSLKQLGQTHEATLYMTLLATFQLLLGRYADEEDILVGSPAACRNLAQLAALVGYLANPLVMRGDLTGSPTFATFLERVRHTVLGAFAHQNYPFPLLVERLQPKRDSDMSPLLRAMFSLQKTKQFGDGDLAAFALGEGTARMKLGELELESLALEQRVVQFDLALVMAETDAGMVGSLQYNSDLFEDATIKRMAGHFQTLLQGIVTDPEQRISQLQMLTAAEERQLLLEWNETAREYPRDKCIHQLFEEQVERVPENIALLYADEQVTYRELNSRANQLAHYLKRMGVSADVLVGLMMERSIEMVVGLLGILKAGGAYVPLDPEYPKERLSFMLEDAGVRVLLTQEHLRESLAVSEVREICLDRDWEVIARESRMNLAVESNAENLAYVIYTSGSTGKPKGTMLAHRGVNNCLLWMQDSLQITEKDRVLLKASLSFDASVWELFLPLIVGAGVVVARPGGHRDGAYLIESIIKHEVTTVHSVPSMLPIILDEKRLAEVSSLTRVICGGEALPVETAQRFLSLSAATLHNFYGPTETSIGSINWICDPHLIKRTVPIGRPIANTQVYILDDNLQPVPIGVPGELHIGTTGLARGYLNQPGLTADRFIPNPFSDEAGARLYRTGDLARYLPNGDIEFLDRIDQQVKLRGFRIELGEIETILGKHPAVLENVVVAREDEAGEKRLVAYVVSNKEIPTVSELRRYLKEKLPEYMIPGAFMVLEEMPLTPGGKLDRRALPGVEGRRLELQVSYVAPRTMTEEIVAGIWAEVLRVERVGVADDFFELGGHSLLATQVISRVR